MILHKIPSAFILLVLLLRTDPSAGQENHSSAPLKVDYRLHYSPDPVSSEKSTNEILTEIAKEVLKEPWKVVVKIGVEIDMRSERYGPATESLHIVVTPAELSGDIRFRSFEISDVLLPSNAVCRFRIVNRSDSSLFREVDICGILKAKPDTVAGLSGEIRFEPGNDTVVFHSLSMSFSEDARNRFLDRLAHINDYYACCALLDTLNMLAGHTDLLETGRLPWNYIRIREITHAIRLMAGRDFPGSLLAGGNDPRHFTEVFTAADKNSRSLAFTFRDVLNESAAIHLTAGFDSLADYFVNRVLIYIRLSQKMSAINGEIYRDWLRNYYDCSLFGNETDIIDLFARKIFPDALPDTLLASLSVRIYDAYRRLALKQMDAGAYADAFALMDHAARFAAQDPFFPKSMMENETITRAARGIFDSYVGIAASCISAGKLSMADRYLQKADDYRLANFYFQFSDSAYNKVFSNLFFIRNTECDRLLESGSYSQALSCLTFLEKTYDSSRLLPLRSGLEEKRRRAVWGLFTEVRNKTVFSLEKEQPDSALRYFDEATELASALPGVQETASFLDSVRPAVSQIRIERLSSSARQAVSQREFNRAIREFGQAAAIAETCKLRLDQVSDSLYRVAVRQNILITLSSQQRFIWTNQFDSAKFYLEKAKRSAEAAGLSSDPELLEAFRRYSSRITDQRCSNLGDTLLVQMVRADRSRAMKNYLRAVLILRQVSTIASANPRCKLPLEGIRDSISRYEKPAIYQQKQEEINTLLASGAYDQAVNLFTENEKFYSVNDLDRFGLTKTTHLDLALSRGNPYLTVKVVQYYLGKKDFPETIRSLQLLRDQGYPSRSAADMMIQLGKWMAGADIRNRPGADPVMNSEKHAGTDSWFSPFRTSYVEEWKKIQGGMLPVH